MTFGTMELIQTVTVGAGGSASIDFQNIPQTYSDLVIKISGRGDLASVITYAVVEFNGVATNRSSRLLAGEGSGTPYSASYASDIFFSVCGASNTASTFGNAELYIPNYTASTNKSISIDQVTENNGTFASANLFAAVWSNSAAINRVTIHAADGSLAKNRLFIQHSTATLYGITRVPAGAKATGGVIYDDSSFWYHVFTSSGTFTPSQSLSCDVLVVAGGGSGGSSLGGGGGAGGLLGHTSQSLTAQNYTITIGGGGAAYRGSSPVNNQGSSGSNSQFGSLTASVGGGRGGAYNTFASGANGGSGGGGGASTGTSTGGTATSGQGNNGAAGGNTGTGQGGGGGAGAAGSAFSSKVGGAGGIGSSTYSSWGLATSTGENSSGTVYFAGGGGGCMDQAGTAAGGLGGGGVGVYTTGSAGDGLAFTGGGGGGHRESATPTTNGGGNGGSGIVIVRYAK